MRIDYSKLTCPHCGSAKFNIIDNDIFLCEYCGESFSFNIDDLDFSNENARFIEQLKGQFSGEIMKIYGEKNEHYKKLIFYKKLANPRAMFYISIFYPVNLQSYLVSTVFFVVVVGDFRVF